MAAAAPGLYPAAVQGIPDSGASSTGNTIAEACLAAELLYLMLWALPLMYHHKALFQAFKLEQHGLAEMLIEKDTVPVTTKMLRGAWVQWGQLQLLFAIAAGAVTWTGQLKTALLMTLIIQAGQTVFVLKEQLLNPFGVDDELRFAKNPRIAAVVALNVVLVGMQYYGWAVAQ